MPRQEYVNEHNLEVIEEVSNCMAELTGQYQNFSLVGKYLPILWIMYIWYVWLPFLFLSSRVFLSTLRAAASHVGGTRPATDGGSLRTSRLRLSLLLKCR